MYIVFRALMSVSVYALTARGGFLSDDSANRVSTLLRRRHRCGQIHSMLDLLKSADFLFFPRYHSNAHCIVASS